jgi:nickel/cobalt exporter
MLLALIFLAGVLHGLGPDHLAAITALSSFGGGATRLVFFSTRFALGHAAVIALAGLAAHFGRGLLPLTWEVRLDVAAGSLLLLAGVAMLVALALGKIKLHAHVHAHDGSHQHRHFHLHFLAKDAHRHGHGRIAAALGALFALGGVRGLLAVVPIAVSQTLAISALRVGAFTFGIIIAMVAYGMVAGPALRWTESRPLLGARVAAAVTAVFCIATGALTISSHWMA